MWNYRICLDTGEDLYGTVVRTITKRGARKRCMEMNSTEKLPGTRYVFERIRGE